MNLKYLVIGALSLAACSDPPTIELQIDTTAGVPCDIDKIRVRAKGSQQSMFEKDIKGVRLPLVVKLSDETDNGQFELEVVGVNGTQEVLKTSGMLQFSSSNLTQRVVLEATCTTEKPCAIDQANPPTAVAVRSQCGDLVRNYNMMPSSEPFIDACTIPGTNSGNVLNALGAKGAAKLGLSDEALAAFNFRFYGQPVRQVWAHEDGYIAFTPDSPDANNDLDPGSFDRDLRGVGVPPPRLSAMIFWDGLTIGPMGICYALDGSPGNQKLRVTWAGTCQTSMCISDNLNFSIVLDERTQVVSFTYGPMTAANMTRAQGATATVGIVNEAKGCTVDKCNNLTGLCDNGTPCGYSQEFSNVQQSGGVKSMDFVPVKAQ